MMQAIRKLLSYFSHISDGDTQAAAVVDTQGQIDAMNRSQAVIEFNMDGTIITANENFLNVMGYRLEDVQGAHHAMFVETKTANSREYKEFWEALKRGEYQARQFKRIGNGGKEIWIQASYNPIFDSDGKPFKVVKFATDITEQKRQDVDHQGQLNAIKRSQAVIEFKMDGTIITANDNFLSAMGYSLEEVQGRHHSMFVTSDTADSADYKEFWQTLNRGEYQSREFKRIGKGGREIWIQASYNPIFDTDGKPYKVVKYATDITEQKQLRQAVESLFAELVRVVNALAEGRLDQRIEGQYENEFAELQDTVNGYCESLKGIVVNIQESANLVMDDADQIKEGNSQLSQRTEGQASNIEETASSMEEMTSAVKGNANSVQEANQLVVGAREQAEQGGAVAKDAVRAMCQINSASKKIADIISVIDDIAFQTNLLALNAAVEAARAGDQGRGFAVVATEVRTLAGRSATAAKEIKSLIEDSVKKVEEGNALVDQSGKSLEDIVESIAKVTDIFGEIAVASREQAAGIEQVNQAITQMDTVTQQNAAMVEEATVASESMREQAKNLSGQVAFFQLDETGVSHAERRSKDRPWSKESTSSSQEYQAQPRKETSTGAEIDQWETF